MINGRKQSEAHTRRRLRPVRRGAAAVEFALTVPTLFLIVFGLIEMARLYQVNGVCMTAAVAAAREGAVLDSTAPSVVGAAERILRPLGITRYTITVTPTPLKNDADQVTVAIDAPLIRANGFIFTNFVGGRTIHKQVVRSRDLE